MLAKKEDIYQDYIPVRKSHLHFYKHVDLYYKAAGFAHFEIYKKSGDILSLERSNEDRFPQLYIYHEDRIKAILDAQQGLNRQLSKDIEGGNALAIKETLTSLVEETLSEPRSGTLNALHGTVDTMVSGFSANPEIMNSIAQISFKDYTTAIHSINVMALTLGFCIYCGFSGEDTKRLGLSALLHDLGKTKIPPGILKASRKLNDNEFKIMRSHTIIGGQMIVRDHDIPSEVAKGAFEHHEKLDGSGYPFGKKNISLDGQVLAIIDTYEALTNEDRPYRRAKKPFETLLMIKEELKDQRLNSEFFKLFCKSLSV